MLIKRAVACAETSEMYIYFSFKLIEGINIYPSIYLSIIQIDVIHILTLLRIPANWVLTADLYSDRTLHPQVQYTDIILANESRFRKGLAF